jgi:hypothetical protein
MALLNSPKFWVGVAVGAAASTLRPGVAESFGHALRPIFKVLIKALLKGSEHGRDIASYMREVVEDATAEAHAELRERGNGHAQPGGGASAKNPGKSSVGSA